MKLTKMDVKNIESILKNTNYSRCFIADFPEDDEDGKSIWGNEPIAEIQKDEKGELHFITERKECNREEFCILKFPNECGVKISISGLTHGSMLELHLAWMHEDSCTKGDMEDAVIPHQDYE